MIITITPNPSVDISYFMDELNLNQTNKCEKIVKTAGGKGINVSKVLKILETDILATGFLGGENGKYIEKELNKTMMSTNFVTINGDTRSSLSICHGNQITEIRETGPFVDDKSKNELISILERNVSNADVICCSGSLPKGLDINFLKDLLEITKDKKFVLDASGDNLRKIVLETEIKPYAIKPNIDEIKDIFPKFSNMSYIEILKLEELKNIPIVIISLGKDGCVAKFNDNFYRCDVPKINAINPVGSGDSSIAGLCYAIQNNYSDDQTLKLSMALGVLNALEEEVGYVNIKRLNETINMIKVEKYEF